MEYSKTMRTCKIEGCDGKHRGKGYCNKHLLQIQRHGKILKRTIREPNEIIVKDDIAEIVLYNNKSQEVARAIIDAEYAERFKKYKWRLGTNGRVETALKEKLVVRIQHIIMGMNPNMEILIDHIDGDPLNNRKSNLRFCTNAENTKNQRKKKNNTSGFKGVSWDKEKKKWAAQITVNQKKIWLGTFEDKVEAAKAYNKAAIKYHGEFAYLNKV